VNVKKIYMRAFMSHESTTVDLPPRGVVVVSGPNGAGKSSLVEAVSVALWGKSLRGSSPLARG
jgi:exonuclease SbcC